MENLLSSIIRQLCAQTQRIPKSVRALWTEHRTAGSRPTKISLIMTLEEVIISLRIACQHAFVVLDGLDEYPLSNDYSPSDRQQTSGREDVLDCFERLFEMHSNVRILILSRDETDIRSKMRKAMKVNVAKYLAGDLDVFIRKNISRIVQEKPWKREYEAPMLSRFKDNDERRVPLNLYPGSIQLTSVDAFAGLHWCYEDLPIARPMR